MSKRVLLSATLISVLFHVCATAQNSPKCSKGYQPFGEGCVTQRMFDYISCVEVSGANRQEITEEVNQVASRQLSGEAKGEGSGAIVHGAGSVALNANSEKELIKKIQQKWYSDAMKHCANVLEPPRKKPSSHGTTDSATATPQYHGTTDTVRATKSAASQSHPQPEASEQSVQQQSSPTQLFTAQTTQPHVTQSCGGGNCAVSVGQQGGLTAGLIVNEEPVTWYDLNGGIHTRRGNKFTATAGDEFTAFQHMTELEKNGDWKTLNELSKKEIVSAPNWPTPYWLLSEAERNLCEKDAAVRDMQTFIAVATKASQFSDTYDSTLQKAAQVLEAVKTGQLPSSCP